MAENPDAPITRITSLEINADPSSPSSVFAPAVLTTAEINAIPLDDLRAGGIVYNINVGSLQTYTINGWENIAVGGSGSDPVFDNITINDTATINTLNVTGTTTTEELSVTDTATINTLNVTGTTTTEELSVTDTATINTLNVTGTTTTEELSVTDTATIQTLNVTNNEIVGGLIYGKRPGGYVYNIAVPTFTVTANTFVKIPGTTQSGYPNAGFTVTNNRLQFVSLTNPGSITVNITGSFSFNFSVATTISLGVAINGVVQNPVTFVTVPLGLNGFLFINVILGMVSNGGVGDYIELWVMSDQNGTFSSGGTMTFQCLAA